MNASHKPVMAIHGLSLRQPFVAGYTAMHGPLKNEVEAAPKARFLVQDLNLELEAGHWLAVIGVNGAGKSSLLRALAGARQLEAGTVLCMGRPVGDYSAQQRARVVSLLAQSVYPTHSARVYDLVMLGRLPWQSWWASPSAADHQAVQSALERCDLAHLSERDWQTLSGGELQRVLIARVMATKARVELYDEPLVNLDPQYQMAWVDAVRAHCAQAGVVVSVLHELHIALQAHSVLLLQEDGSYVHGRAHDRALKEAMEAAFKHRVKIAQNGTVTWQ